MHDPFAEESDEESRVLGMPHQAVQPVGCQTGLSVRTVEFAPALREERLAAPQDEGITYDVLS